MHSTVHDSLLTLQTSAEQVYTSICLKTHDAVTFCLHGTSMNIYKRIDEGLVQKSEIIPQSITEKQDLGGFYVITLDIS